MDKDFLKLLFILSILNLIYFSLCAINNTNTYEFLSFYFAFIPLIIWDLIKKGDKNE